MADDITPDPNAPATVPSSRLREETAAKREALDRVNALEGELSRERTKSKGTDALAAQVTSLTTEVTTLKSTLEKERAAWNEERAVYAAGITDPEAVDVARHLHSKLPEKDRPAFPDWLKAQAADPAKAHKALAGFLTPASAPPSGSGTPSGGPPSLPGAPPAQPRTMAANRPSPPATGAPAGGDLSLDQAKARISELATLAGRSGDWKQYDAERPALLARIAQG